MSSAFTQHQNAHALARGMNGIMHEAYVPNAPIVRSWVLWFT